MKFVTVSALAFVSLLFASSGVVAQSRLDRSRWPSAQQMLEHFEQVSRGERGSLNAMALVLGEPGSFPPAKVDSLLNGLEVLATSAPEQRVQIAALTWLAGAGRGAVHPALHGIAGRLGRVYERASSVPVRRIALRHLGSQADQEASARILHRIAQQDSTSERVPDAAHDAIWGLTHLGAPGTRVLRELHSRRLIRDPMARSAIQQVARQRGWAESTGRRQ